MIVIFAIITFYKCMVFLDCYLILRIIVNVLDYVIDCDPFAGIKIFPGKGWWDRNCKLEHLRGCWEHLPAGST
jgi:hypothetical protein